MDMLGRNELSLFWEGRGCFSWQYGGTRGQSSCLAHGDIHQRVLREPRTRGHPQRSLPAAWKAGAILSSLVGFVQCWSASCPCNFGTA